MRRSRTDEGMFNSMSFLDAMANTVGALAFLLLMVVVVTVAVRLHYFDLRIETPAELPTAEVGRYYEIVLAGSGGNEPYTWELVAASLPPGLHFASGTEEIVDQNGDTYPAETAKIYGTPLEATAEPVRFTVRLDDTAVEQGGDQEPIDKPAVEKDFFLTVSPPPFHPLPLVVKTASLPPAVVGAEYALQLAVEGGVPPYTWTLEGATPPGLLLERSGRLSGRPQVPGSWQLTVGVRDDRGAASEHPVPLRFEAFEHRDANEVIDTVLKPLAVLTDSLPPPVAGIPYRVTLAASGGVPPYRWAVDGALPADLSLGPDGVISGTASAPGLSEFGVVVRSAEGAPRADEARRNLELRVEPAPQPVPPVELF